MEELDRGISGLSGVIFGSSPTRKTSGEFSDSTLNALGGREWFPGRSRPSADVGKKIRTRNGVYINGCAKPPTSSHTRNTSTTSQTIPPAGSR
jgi:hypothetical protein